MYRFYEKHLKRGDEKSPLVLCKVMITESRIRELVEEKLAGSPNYLVDVVISPVNKIMVFLDSDDKISISDCVAVSRHIEGSLNRDEEDFSLDVSSAGMERPLKLVRQYKKRIGRNVDVITTEGIKVEGKLVAADDEAISVETLVKEKVNGKKQKIVKTINLNYNQIKETKVKISFK